MKEENTNVSKNGWKRMVRKKWFFPAVYLVFAALLLSGVMWYQNLENQLPQTSNEPGSELSNDSNSGSNGDLDEFNQEADLVMEQQEVVQMPVAELNKAEIVTKFYDYGADSEDQVKALVQYNNKFYQSNGVDIAFTDGKSFEVIASLSGTVTEVKEDPLLGHVVEIEHQNGITTHYASSSDILVEEGAEVKQGDTIASAGRNLIGQDNGIHVHFEIRKEGVSVDPEDFFNRPLSEIEVPKEDEEEEEEEESTENSTSEENSSSQDDAANQEDATNQENSTNQEDASNQEDATTEESSEGEGDGNGDDSGEDESEQGSQSQETNTNTNSSSAAMANA